MKIRVILLIITGMLASFSYSMENQQILGKPFWLILQDGTKIELRRSVVDKFKYLRAASENGMKETYEDKIVCDDIEPASARMFAELLAKFCEFPEASREESLLKEILAIPQIHENIMGILHKADQWEVHALYKALLRASICLVKQEVDAAEAIEHSRGNTQKLLQNATDIIREKKHLKNPSGVLSQKEFPLHIPELRDQITSDLMPKIFGKTPFELNKVPTINDNTLKSLAYDSSTDKLILCSNDQITLHDAKTGKADIPINNQSIVKTALFDEKKKQIITAGYHGLINIWNVNGSKAKSVQHSTRRCVSSLGIDSTSETLAAGGHDKFVHLWDQTTWQKKATVPVLAGFPNSFIFEDNGIYIAHDLGLHFWDSKEGTLTSYWGTKSKNIPTPFKCLTNHPNENFIIGTAGRKIMIMDKRKKAVISTFEGHTGNAYSLIICPEAQCLISSSYDKTVRIWNLETAKCFQKIEKQNHELLAFDSKQMRVFTNGLDGAINISTIPHDPKKLLELYAKQLEDKKN
ncbi:hypothetical protein HYX58_03890 [Candidatus Dependentiae bacterium]|nr:hypothetical protein [Candidatus Dependentiae bacterium]